MSGTTERIAALEAVVARTLPALWCQERTHGPNGDMLCGRPATVWMLTDIGGMPACERCVTYYPGATSNPLTDATRLAIEAENPGYKWDTPGGANDLAAIQARRARGEA